ncbi:hypothetical protein [Cryobacterium zhongshanensis]|uniref:Uncharacterized protein n=1 Tax=Cryobacterium zhongshanensis TaxID=2928153 RepID=A0AA41UG83_9MICO|nr:hypothetical protein [Cryobacterium zhongshanensis]MCI4658927.1 hypothetical protein [Cryobacterium zhongshanensis]
MPTDDEIRIKLKSDEIMERLATVEHERWAHWQRYVHGQGERQSDGSLLIPAELVARWEQQIATGYADLSIEEQKSDQEQVRRYLPTVLDALTGPPKELEH